MGYVSRRIQDVERSVKRRWSQDNAHKSLSYIRDGNEHFNITFSEIQELKKRFDQLMPELNALVMDSRISDEKALENAGNIMTYTTEIQIILKKLRGMWSRF